MQLVGMMEKRGMAKSPYKRIAKNDNELPAPQRLKLQKKYNCTHNCTQTTVMRK